MLITYLLYRFTSVSRVLLFWVAFILTRPLGAVVGAAALAYAARIGLTGQTPAAVSGPLDILIVGGLGLVVVWMVWLAARLLLGR